MRFLLLFLAAIPVLSGEPADEFNHKRHGALKLECAFCHAGATKAERAGFPAAGQCMLCHQTLPKTAPLIEKIAAMPNDEKPFQTRYHLLPDFVFFSHARHMQAKLECASCHGSVFTADSAKPVMALKMKACIDCHTEHKAKKTCDVCHEPMQ